jgi:hypothetical protein
MVAAFVTVLPVGIEDDFRAGSSREPVRSAYQFVSELGVIVDLAAKGRPRSVVDCGYRPCPQLGGQ